MRRPLRVADLLFVVGWPYGDQGSWPAAVWSTAFVATEPDMRWDGRSAFLLDCRTRHGQSGALLLRHVTPNDTVVLADGDTLEFGVIRTVLVGDYTGRIDADGDLGMVYMCEAVREALALLPALRWPTSLSRSLGPLSVTKTGRTGGPDGVVTVAGTANQDYESVVIARTAYFRPRDHVRSPFTHRHLLKLVQGTRTAAQWRVGSWVGSGASTGAFSPSAATE